MLEIVIMLFFLIIAAAIYIAYPRQTKNFVIATVKRKRFVVVHMNLAGTQFKEDYNVVPEKDKLTLIKKFGYDLNEKYATMMWKKRLHYIVDENNSIPKHFTTDNNEEVLFQAKEIGNALRNDAYEKLFTKKQDLALILCAAFAVLLLVVVIYDAYVIVQANSLMTRLLEQTAQSQIQPK